LNIDDIETKDNHESSTEDDGEVVDEDDIENSDPDEEIIIQTRSRGKSRSTLLKTGKPGKARFTNQLRLHVRTRSLRMRSWREMMPNCD